MQSQARWEEGWRVLSSPCADILVCDAARHGGRRNAFEAGYAAGGACCIALRALHCACPAQPASHSINRTFKPS